MSPVQTSYTEASTIGEEGVEGEGEVLPQLSVIGSSEDVRRRSQRRVESEGGAGSTGSA